MRLQIIRGELGCFVSRLLSLPRVDSVVGKKSDNEEDGRVRWISGPRATRAFVVSSGAQIALTSISIVSWNSTVTSCPSRGTPVARTPHARLANCVCTQTRKQRFKTWLRLGRAVWPRALRERRFGSCDGLYVQWQSRP